MMTISPSQRNEEGGPGARKRPRLCSRPKKSRAAQSRGPITSTVVTVAITVKEENHGCRDAHERLGLYARRLCLAINARRRRRAVRLSHRRGLHWAGLVGFVAAFGVLALLFDTLRSPILRLIVGLVFAAPAAFAGYALVHGATEEFVPSEIWRTIFCMIGGAFVGTSALLRLTTSARA